MNAGDVQQKIRALGRPPHANARFFKYGPGEYGEGDLFVGLNAATMHGLAREFVELPLKDIEILLQSEIHEDRMVALLILVRAFAKGDAARKRAIFELYLASTARVNNWDLVDASAPVIVGGYLRDRKRGILKKLARSKSLWERRIAIVGTLHWIRAGDFADGLAIAEQLLRDREDLIHKAAGWMLREIGKRDEAVLRGFLEKHAAVMPRTMLRYAIEKFAPSERSRFLGMRFNGKKATRE